MTTAGPPERMLADLPVTTRTLDLGGVSTAVIEAGAGPPLLLLHGGIESQSRPGSSRRRSTHSTSVTLREGTWPNETVAKWPPSRLGRDLRTRRSTE